MRSLANDTIFLTGFPGFIASRLLIRLAAEGKRFLLLTHPSFAEKAKAEVSSIAAETNRPVSDFALLPGDVTQPELGLSSNDVAIVRSEATVLFHLAAIYDLAVERNLAMRVNLGGTVNVNDLARSMSRLEQYHYVSTCYVAGKRKGVIYETELQHNAGFRNNYEESKYLAETEVEAMKPRLPVTIHRPAVVCGDSLTGETAKYDGIYYLIRYLLKWPSVNSILNIGNTDVALNLVPVDFVVEAMAGLARDERAIGKTAQLADPAPLTTKALFDTIARCVSGKSSRLSLPSALVNFALMLPFAPRVTDLPHAAVPYFFLKQTYDTKQSRDLLDPLGIRCPAFDSYVETIVDYAAQHPVL